MKHEAWNISFGLQQTGIVEMSQFIVMHASAKATIYP